MSVGSDNNKLPIPPAVVPSISVDPPTPELTAKTSSPRKMVTRAKVKMALTPSQIALGKFIEVSDRLSEFEYRTNTPSPIPHTLSMLNIRREECNECTGCTAEAPDSLPILKDKYGYCYSVYERCGTQIADMIAQAPQVQAVPTQTYISSGCRLPPCGTEVFTGDYLRWPTIRDLFTAIYINNPGLTPVEKLFHLNAKTSGY